MVGRSIWLMFGIRSGQRQFYSPWLSSNLLTVPLCLCKPILLWLVIRDLALQVLTLDLLFFHSVSSSWAVPPYLHHIYMRVTYEFISLVQHIYDVEVSKSPHLVKHWAHHLYSTCSSFGDQYHLCSYTRQTVSRTLALSRTPLFNFYTWFTTENVDITPSISLKSIPYSPLLSHP